MFSKKIIAPIVLVIVVYVVAKLPVFPGIRVFNLVLSGDDVGEAVLVSVAFIAFTLWVYATIPYGFSSVFGRVFICLLYTSDAADE